MNKLKVTELVKKSLVKIAVIDKKTNKVRNQGSGIIINEFGFVLTAYHVVSSVENEENIAMIIPYRGSPYYAIFSFGGLTNDFGFDNIVKPSKMDLAILTPLSLVSTTPIKFSDEIPIEGIDVIMAGFPIDLKNPFDFSERIDETKVGGKLNLDKIKEFSNMIIPWIMVKHGIVGGVYHIYISNFHSDILDKPFPLHAAEYWVDNTYAPGASGGPVVNMKGQLLGIITERGETNESDFTDTIVFPVPSGTVRVLSHKLITWCIEKLEEVWKKHHKLPNHFNK